MKHFLRIPALILFSCLLLVACDDSDEPEPTILEGDWRSSVQTAVYYDAAGTILFESTGNDTSTVQVYRGNRMVERVGTDPGTSSTFQIFEQDGKDYVTYTPIDLQGLPGFTFELVEVTATKMTLRSETPFALYNENGELKEADKVVETEVFVKL